MAAITLLSSDFTPHFKISSPIITRSSHYGSLSFSSSSSYSRVFFLQSDSRVLSNRLRWIRCQALGDNNNSLDSTLWSVHQSDVREKRQACCFPNEEADEVVVEDKLLEDEKLGGPELDQSNVAKMDLLTSLKEAANAVFKIPGKPWTVPWTVETILQVMLLWIASFWFVGSWIVPFLAHAAGFSKESLTYRGQALYSLLTDVAEGLTGIAILNRCLSRFQPLPSDWFRFNLRGNLRFDVALGCLMFPLVNRLSQVNLKLVPHLPSTPITVSSVEQSIVARDPVAMTLYAIVVAVCAPMWEEILFRGFLLPSLTKYMPVWCSILVSSVVFALAHFNAQRMLPLIFLGMIMGAVFTRSRNLFASMLLHSLWNGFVFLDLMK